MPHEMSPGRRRRVGTARLRRTVRSGWSVSCVRSSATTMARSSGSPRPRCRAAATRRARDTARRPSAARRTRARSASEAVTRGSRGSTAASTCARSRCSAAATGSRRSAGNSAAAAASVTASTSDREPRAGWSPRTSCCASAADLRRAKRQPQHVLVLGVLRPATPLSDRQHPVGIDLLLETVEERLPRLRGHGAAVVSGVHRVGGEPCTLPSMRSR